MSMPNYQAASARIESTSANITIAWPGHTTNDIALLYVCTQLSSQTLATPAGFTAIATYPLDGNHVHVFWHRATSSSMSSPVASISGSNWVMGQMLTFRGCVTSGNPWEVIVSDANVPPSTSFSIPGTTITVPNSLIVALVAWQGPGSGAKASGWTNANLSSLTERADGSLDFGGITGGGFAIATGGKVTAGDYGATTGSLADARPQSHVSMSLKDPAWAPHTRTPSAGALVLTGIAPVVSQSLKTPTQGTLSLAGSTPNILGGTAPQPVAGGITLVGAAPVVTSQTTIRPDAGSLVLSGTTPTLVRHDTIRPSTGVLALQGVEPQNIMAGTITPSRGELSLTGSASSLNLRITPSTAVLTLTDSQPISTQDYPAQPSTAVLVLTGTQPTLVQNHPVNPSTGVLALNGAAPAVAAVTFMPPVYRFLFRLARRETILLVSSSGKKPKTGV
jgi:hypothetical protein